MASDATAAAAAAAATANSVEEEFSLLPLSKEAAMEAVVVAKEPEKEMVTPKSENSVLKQATLCPPAPRKLQPVRRKALAELPQNKCYAVRRDLSSVFVKLPVAGPPKKRNRLL